MSDQRERVARAAYEANLAWQKDDGWGYPPDWDNEHPAVLQCWRQIADAAIDAYEATEPTEAEIEAARHEYITKHDAYIEAAKANAECQCYARDDYPECVERIYENAGHEAMRAALLAARKAQR